MDDTDTPAPAGDDIVLGDIPSDGSDGAGADVTAPGNGGAGTVVPGVPSVVTCSGTEVTVNLDDRAYTSVTDVGGSMASVSAADPSTLPGLLRAMFGEYTPKTQTVTTYFDGEPLDVSTEYVPGVAGMDMEWIASVLLFGVVVYCLFRLLGGMVR